MNALLEDLRAALWTVWNRRWLALGVAWGVCLAGWLAGYARTRLDELSALSANAYANWFESGFDLTGNAINYSATLAYDRRFIRGLSGIAAVGLDGITRDYLPDFSTASALLGLRYAF